MLRGEEIDPNAELSDAAGAAPFGLSAHIFYRQSESLEIVEPELNVTRAAVLDYFHELGAQVQSPALARHRSLSLAFASLLSSPFLFADLL